VVIKTPAQLSGCLRLIIEEVGNDLEVGGEGDGAEEAAEEEVDLTGFVGGDPAGDV